MLESGGNNHSESGRINHFRSNRNNQLFFERFWKSNLTVPVCQGTFHSKALDTKHQSDFEAAKRAKNHHAIAIGYFILTNFGFSPRPKTVELMRLFVADFPRR